MYQCGFTYTVLSQKSVYSVAYLQRYVIENRTVRLVAVADVFYLYHSFLSVALMYNTANVREAEEKNKEEGGLLIYFSSG